MSKPKVLLTNDDGIFAPGIRHLWNAIKDLADVAVVAPAAEQSASSLSVTLRQPLRIEKVCWPGTEVNAWSVSGTPADCVKLALSVILNDSPHLILSGINQGTNAGRNVLYSGTVAGVIEGILRGIPGIAFSTGDLINPDFVRTEPYIPQIMKYVLRHPLPEGTFLNVNFPSNRCTIINGIKMSRQGKEYWAEDPECRDHPSGHSYYWLGSKLAEYSENENSDIVLLRKGYITATPIHVGELTDHSHISLRQHVFESFVNARSD